MLTLRSKVLLSLAGVASVLACSGGAGDPTIIYVNDSGAYDGSYSAAQSMRTEESNGRCLATPTELNGSATAGADCTSFADCKPTCCECNGSGPLAAACVDGKCATGTKEDAT